jgi:hypothetical protein
VAFRLSLRSFAATAYSLLQRPFTAFYPDGWIEQAIDLIQVM